MKMRSKMKQPQKWRWPKKRRWPGKKDDITFLFVSNWRVSGKTYLFITEENMQQITDSDNKNSAMIASFAFQDILDHIQSSNLNFQLKVSPF